MNLRSIFVSVFFLFPIYMFANITGTYEVVGFDPLTGDYTGTLVITKQDDIYTSFWDFSGGSTAVGTGVREGDDISFVFDEDGGASFGVQLYEINCHTLFGPWVRFEAVESGFETSTKISNHTNIPG